MRCRQARNAIVGALLAVAAALPARAASIDLSLSLTLDASATDHAVITGIIRNTGTLAAFDVYAELWPDHTRQRLGDLQPGGDVQVSWTIPRDRWVNDLRQIGAMRVRYRDALEHWADAVVAAGMESGLRVSAPIWPEPAAFSVSWTQAPSPSGRIVWWRPFALGVLAADSWKNAHGLLEINGHVSPSSAIGGWKSSIYGLVLPDSSDGVTPPGSVVHIDVDARDRGPLWRVEWPLVISWLGICVAVWAARSRRSSGLPALTTVAALGAVALALIPPRLIALDTTPAGGDYASHIVGLGYLRDVLLPAGRAFGWFPGQFGGFPLYLFYFPLPFLAAAALSAFVPLTVAMKAASLIGTILLPIGWWFTLAWLRAPFSARWLAAAASAWLVLGEWQTVWGANLPSTLAGEFAYSVGYVLAWMTVAYAWKTRDDVGRWRGLAVLFALTAMSHGYALVAAACGVLLMVIHPGRGPLRAWRLAWVGAIAFGLAAWWLVPFLWNAPWTVGVRGQWILKPSEYLPAPVLAAMVIGGVGVVRRALQWRDADAAGVMWLAAFTAAMLGMYAAGFSLGVVDVRFLPFFHGGLLLLACWEAGSWLEWLRPSMVPVAVSLVVVAIVGSAVRQVTYLPDWIRWNLNGMENTGPWPFFNDVMRNVEGQLSDPRVVFEHHPDHDAVGTTRAFEMLPWFAGRSTLEGLYRESALLSPPVYYIQSELTRTASCPIEGLECGRFNPGGVLPHLGLFAADTIVAYGDALARALEEQSGVSLRAESGPYKVFSIDQPRPIVEPARFRPVVDHSDDWRGDAYDWFRAATDLDVPLVLRRSARAGELQVQRYAARSLPREPLETAPEVTTTQRDGTIEIENARPGHPLFVKVAFHPGWRTDDGSPIDVVAPGMMLVTPHSSRVVLRWTSGSAGLIGLLLSIGSLLVLAVVREIPALAPREAARTAGYAWCAAVIVVTGSAITYAIVAHPPARYGDLMPAAQRAAAEKDFTLADRLYERILAAPDRHHALRDDAGLYFVLSADAAGDQAKTEARIRLFLDEFRVSTFRSEVLVRLGRLLHANGRVDEARHAFSEAIDAPLGDPAWVDQARAALAEPPAS